MPSPCEKFQALLMELFQFDCADLDFGIYRILNYKRDAVKKFIEKDLPEAVRKALSTGVLASDARAAAELADLAKKIDETFGEKALDADGALAEQFHSTPLGKRYVELRARASGAQAMPALEAAVFNHLYAFFSRYYDEGDFISKRRYSRREKYAIPYNGEEVYLHWANSDQYYVKTGEYFTDYRFTSGGVTAHFRIQQADVPQNNVKGEKRFFVPLAKEAAFDAKRHEVTVPFEYRPLTEAEGTKYGQRNQQEAILAEGAQGMLSALKKDDEAVVALEAAHHKGGDGRDVSVLAHHLRQYTQRNTSDFFIHKDLKGFLTRELDFYIKNEVLNLDEMEAAGETRAAGWFQIVQALKDIGGRIIEFLAQIEDFQKMLFEKKKFVTETQYCITVGNIGEEFYGEIAANDAQWAEWRELFHIDEEQRDIFNVRAKARAALRVTFLTTHPTLVLDTKHFHGDFMDRLVGSFDDLDGMTDGMVVHSENFQAIGMLRGKHSNGIDCIYIDPPYNTDASPILYKNGYKCSTWLSLMESRLLASRALLTADGVLVTAIDDEQQRELSLLLSQVFEGRLLGTISVRSNPSGRPTQSGYSVAHEYLLYAGNGPESAIRRMPPTEEQLARFSEKDERGVFEWRNLRREGSNSDRAARPALYYPMYVKGASIRVPRMTWNEAALRWNVEEKPLPGEQVVVPDNEQGVQKTWRWEWRTVVGALLDLAVREDRSGRDYIYYKRRPHEEGVVSISCWFDAKYSAAEHGTALLKALFGESVFSYPKSIHAVIDSLYIAGASKPDAVVCDFFAGSGTTGHAVISLNREHGGNRKFILVEMGEYVDTILIPRIKRVAFSPEWKDGIPVRQVTAEEADRSPRIVKYVRVESYEDALNNIVFGREASTLYEYDDYLMGYMLGWGAKQSGTLLNIEQLGSPFSYRLRLTAGQATRERIVDVPETFAYLLGLHVKTRRAALDGERRYLVYRGKIDHRGIAVIWRETAGWEKKDYERDKAFVEKQKLTEGADEIFVNGDSLIPGAKSLDGIFKARMFAGV